MSLVDIFNKENAIDLYLCLGHVSRGLLRQEERARKYTDTDFCQKLLRMLTDVEQDSGSQASPW